MTRSVPAAVPTLVDDVHSRLNATVVADVVTVDGLDAIRATLQRSREEGIPVAVSGGRHAMGGQQFCPGGLLLDMRAHHRVTGFDRERGLVEVQAGVQWPALMAYLDRTQPGSMPTTGPTWAIRQKQTGADRLTLGGALAANVHGRGLTLGPIVDDVESLTLVDATGELRRCSRDQDAELFGLAIGGYGLVGVIESVTLRLAPRELLERVVVLLEVDDLMPAFDARIAEGFRYGDFQFAIDPDDESFLRHGVFSCYRPVDTPTQAPPPPRRVLSRDAWRDLIHLAHVDKTRAWDVYTEHYLATSGQLYGSDRHQSAEYVDDYHAWVDGRTPGSEPGTEMITELYVPRERLADFMAEAGDALRACAADVVYGTVRLIEREATTFLPWARERWACVVLNLHVVHTPAGLEAAVRSFRMLIDLAVARGGSYYLTYHRWARRDQVEACYPQLPAFLEAKRRLDPDGRFASEWYRHLVAMFA